MTFQSEFVAWLGYPLPPQYEEYLRSVDGGETTIGDVLLYGADLLKERNETYEVKLYCPGDFTIGDDGGGRGVILRVNDGSVHLVDHGAMTPDCMTQLSGSFREWYAANCTLPDEDEDDRSGPSQLVLVDTGAATAPRVAKELRAELAIPLKNAMAMARTKSVVLMDRSRHSPHQMAKLSKILMGLGANVRLTQEG